MYDHRILAHVAFFPEQIAGQVVEGIGGDEILAQGRIRAKDGNTAKGDLGQWKVPLLICNSFQESLFPGSYSQQFLRVLFPGSFSCLGSDHVGGVLPPPSSRLHLLCHDDQRHLHPRRQSYYSQQSQSRSRD